MLGPATIFERIAEEVKTALLQADIPGIEERVERAREDAVTFDDGDSLNVMMDSNSQKVFSESIDDNELLVDVCISVRATGDSANVWETKADEYARQIHPVVMRRNYFAAGLKIARVRLTDQDWQAEAGDNTPGKRTLKYSVRFLTLADDITQQP
ncbi:MAG TPA: hypothetical protein VE008_07335 [Burkholderiales bacterium]|nr:hypothetical protein [Burkholderiales bacterium]